MHVVERVGHQHAIDCTPLTALAAFRTSHWAGLSDGKMSTFVPSNTPHIAAALVGERVKVGVGSLLGDTRMTLILPHAPPQDVSEKIVVQENPFSFEFPGRRFPVSVPVQVVDGLKFIADQMFKEFSSFRDVVGVPRLAIFENCAEV